MLTNKTPETLQAEAKPAPKTAKRMETSLFDEPVSTSTAAKKTSTRRSAQASGGTTTRVTVKFDVGFHNHLTIRGKGANLSWTKGIPLKNQGADEWTWETDAPFEALEFKVLVNDHHYENGENHLLKQGQTLHYTPSF